jgi:hypothetical protein
MSIQAAIPVALPYLSPCMVDRAFESLPACNGGDGARRLQPRESGHLRPFLFNLGSPAVRRASTLTRFLL